MDSAPTSPRRLGRRPALDGLRALAVLLVIGIHVGLLVAGYIGVDVFLPLSGLLITVLLYEEWERTGGISLSRFYQRRVRRLAPALALVVGVFALVMVVLHPFSLEWPLGKLIAATLLCVNNWVSTLDPSHGSVLNALSPTWTLAEEVQFYLLWPPVLLTLLHRGVRPRTVLALLAVAIVALVAGNSVAEHVYASWNPYTSPLDRGAELLLGAAAAIVWRERLVPAVLRRPVVGWLAAGGIAYLVASGKPSIPVWYLTAAALSMVLIVNLLTNAQSVLVRGLSWGPLAYVGRISYGIYLFHVPIYYVFWTYVRVGSPPLYYPVVVALSIAAAAASWHLLESRALRGRPQPRRRSPLPERLVPRRLAMRSS